MNYQKIYDNIINKRTKEKPEGYVEVHHILPKCLGGSDDTENLVALTAREHFIAHWLLSKIHKSSSLSYAFLRMYCIAPTQEGQRYIPKNSKIYDKAKSDYSKRLKEYYATHGISEETRKRMSNTRKARVTKQSTLEKMSKSLTGYNIFEYWDRIVELWISNDYPGYVRLRKICVKHGLPDIAYQVILNKIKQSTGIYKVGKLKDSEETLAKKANNGRKSPLREYLPQIKEIYENNGFPNHRKLRALCVKQGLPDQTYAAIVTIINASK